MIASAARAQCFGARSATQGGEPGLDALDRQHLHDDAGGKRQDLMRFDAEGARGGGARGAGVGEARFARARVGYPGVDQDRPRARMRMGEVVLANQHGLPRRSDCA
jgi:hypothetical protein